MHILFDLDGTLTDPYEGIAACIAHALEALAVPVPEELRWCVGPPLLDTFRTLLAGHTAGNAPGPEALEEQAHRALALYRERFARRGMYENRVYPGVREMLAALAGAGHRLYVATSKPHVYARPILAHFGLAERFRAIHGAELDGTRVSKAELIAHLLAQEGVAPGAAVMVGDREHDLIGARANGVRALAVGWGYGGAAELSAQDPEVICRDPAHLAAYLLEGG